MARREVSSRRVEPPTSWEKREMMEMLRKKEEEHRLKEQELRLQRERERLKFERERFERERLELQQLRQIAALTTPVQMMSAPGAPPLRRSHEYGDMDSSRYKSEKELKYVLIRCDFFLFLFFDCPFSSFNKFRGFWGSKWKDDKLQMQLETLQF